MAYYCSEEEERLQKKLIPLNIVVCILCLVTVISLLIAPLIKIDLKKFDVTVITDMVGTDNSEGSDSSESGGVDIGAMFENLDGEISVTTIDLGKIAFSGSNAFAAFIDALLVKSGVVESMLVPMAEQTLLQQLDVDTQDLDLSALDAKFRALGNVRTPEAMRAAAADLIDEINNLAPDTIDALEKAEAIDMFEDMYNDTVEATGGEYDLEKFLCVLASGGLGLSEPVTSYTDLLVGVIDKDGVLSNQIKAKTGFDLDMVAKVLALLLFGIAALACGVWFILFLFALFHTFAQNKRFMMWYVKLWGVYPCLLFGTLSVLTLGVISTFTWINGACYLLLWAFSIFWAFPIKRKIRADRKS